PYIRHRSTSTTLTQEASLRGVGEEIDDRADDGARHCAERRGLRGRLVRWHGDEHGYRIGELRSTVTTVAIGIGAERRAAAWTRVWMRPLRRRFVGRRARRVRLHPGLCRLWHPDLLTSPAHRQPSGSYLAFRCAHLAVAEGAASGGGGLVRLTPY